VNYGIHYLVAECLEPRAHQLHNGPAIVSVHHQRRASIRLAMDDAIRIGNGLQTDSATHCALDPRAPPLDVNLDVGIGFNESKRDLRFRAPQRPAKRPVATVAHQDHPGIGRGTLRDITAVDPRVA
jgi:hypothetical protein